MKKFYSLILAVFIFSTTSVVAQRSTFTIENGGYYIERQKQGSEKKRFFAIGMNVHGWPQSTMSNCTRYPSDKEFTSARNIFTVLNLRYTHIDTTNQKCFGLPSYVTTNNHSDAILMSGSGHTSFRLRVSSTVNNGGGVLCPDDISNLEVKLGNNPDDMDMVETVLDEIIEYSEANGTSDIIYWSQDEPEYGIRNYVSSSIINRSWHTSGDIIEYFMDEAHNNGLISYLDLGPNNPQHGNNFLYDDRGTLTIPNNNLQDYSGYDYFTPSWEATIKETVREYESVTDILGINSYTNTSLQPWNLGQLVRWMHQEASNIPVLPWVSAECSRYGRSDCIGSSIETNFYRNIRSQAYSAIINRSTGVMFWADRNKSNHEKWDEILDIAKELHYFKFIFENGSFYQNYQNTNSMGQTINEGIAFDINGDWIVFENDYDPIESTITFMPSLGSDLNLTYPRNLGFEDIISTITGPIGNWKLHDPSGSDTEASLNINLSNVKIGSSSLYLYDASQTERVQVEQYFDIIPEYEYQARGWYNGVSGWQRMIMLFYGPNGYISEHQIQSSSSTNGSWVYLESDTVRAPIGANRMKLHIGTKHNNWNNITSEGYWDDVMVRIVGDGGVSSKILPKNDIDDHIHGFKLNQNYPNPFNPKTTISFSLKEKGFVTLKVFSLLGQPIATLIEEVSEAGNHTFNFNASNYPSGVYIYELEFKNSVLRRKMTLIK